MGEWLPVIGWIVGAGGLGGLLIAIIKLRPEAGQIAVTAAQGAVIVQTGVIDDLQEELSRQKDKVAALERDLIQMHIENNRQLERFSEMERHLASVEVERDRLRRERDDLRHRVTILEAQVRELNSANGE